MSEMLLKDFEQLLKIEDFANDAIAFKRAYVDLSGDLIAGLILAQLIYWASRSKKDGQTRMRVPKDGKYWLAKNREDWWEECRITPTQYDRGIKILRGKGLVEVINSMFNDKRTPFLRINGEGLVKQLNDFLIRKKQGLNPCKKQVRSSCYMNTGLKETLTPITETYTENYKDEEKRYKKKRSQKKISSKSKAKEPSISHEGHFQPVERLTATASVREKAKTRRAYKREALDYYDDPDVANGLRYSFLAFKRVYEIYPSNGREFSVRNAFAEWHTDMKIVSESDYNEKRPLIERIIRHIEAKCETREWREGFMPNFARYFRDQRWEDVIEGSEELSIDPEMFR